VIAEEVGEELRDGAEVIDVVLVVEDCRRRYGREKVEGNR
jgi:hypothetical protein